MSDAWREGREHYHGQSDQPCHEDHDDLRDAEITRLREKLAASVSALRQIYSVAAHRLNDQSLGLADIDYAAFDHIAGIARRSALKEETT